MAHGPSASSEHLARGYRNKGTGQLGIAGVGSGQPGLQRGPLAPAASLCPVIITWGLATPIRCPCTRPRLSPRCTVGWLSDQEMALWWPKDHV